MEESKALMSMARQTTIRAIQRRLFETPDETVNEFGMGDVLSE
jgi:hypothetical protein